MDCEPSRRRAWTDLGRIAAMRHHFLQPWCQSIDGFHGKDSLVKPPISRTSKEWVCTPRTPHSLSRPPLSPSISQRACNTHGIIGQGSPRSSGAHSTTPHPPATARPAPPSRSDASRRGTVAGLQRARTAADGPGPGPASRAEPGCS